MLLGRLANLDPATAAFPSSAAGSRGLLEPAVLLEIPSALLVPGAFWNQQYCWKYHRRCWFQGPPGTSSAAGRIISAAGFYCWFSTWILGL